MTLQIAIIQTGDGWLADVIIRHEGRIVTFNTSKWRTRAQALVAAVAWAEEWEVCQRNNCTGLHS